MFAIVRYVNATHQTSLSPVTQLRTQSLGGMEVTITYGRDIVTTPFFEPAADTRKWQPSSDASAARLLCVYMNEQLENVMDLSSTIVHGEGQHSLLLEAKDQVMFLRFGSTQERDVWRTTLLKPTSNETDTTANLTMDDPDRHAADPVNNTMNDPDRHVTDPANYIRWTALDPTSFSAREFKVRCDEITIALSGWAWSGITILVSRTGDGPTFPTLLVSVFPQEKASINLITNRLQAYRTILRCKVMVTVASPNRQDSDTIRCGSSVAARGARNRGTIGGVLKLGDRLIGITCHHVVFAPLRPAPNAQRPEPEDPLKVEDFTSWRVTSPAGIVVEKRKEEARRLLKEDTAARAAYLKSCFEINAPTNFLRAYDVSISNCKGILAAKDPLVMPVIHGCQELQHVQYYGRLVNLDWTAIDLSQAPNVEVPNRLRLAGLDTPYPNNKCLPLRIHGNGDLGAERNLRVYKAGATGATCGVVNGVWERVCLDPKLLEDGKKRYTDEICVIGDFSRSGDSGSWVVADSELVGMVIGGVEGNETPHRTYITDISLIVKDLQKQSGLTPKLPFP